jgi:membrane-bound lytic murein transglycosylase A
MKLPIFIALTLLISGCARTKIARLEDSMRVTTLKVPLSDSLSKESFFQTLKKHIAVMKISRQVSDPLVFGTKKITKSDYIHSLEKILEHESDANWNEWIEKNFVMMEVYGRKNWGEVMTTGYYEPLVRGSHTPSSEFSQPLYKTPDDLVIFDPKAFSFPMKTTLLGRVENNRLVPYFDRKAIDSERSLAGRNLELAWVEPIDAFLIHIQGSGVVEFSDGKTIRVGYDTKNGRPYVSIGKVLKDSKKLSDVTFPKIKDYLKTLSNSEQQNLLNENPSYVFFKILNGESLTFTGMEVSPGRTIATDKSYFPKGALAFLDIDEPVFDSPEASVPKAWKRLPRFVFDEDTGGAIKGADRVDLYFGKGPSAYQSAGIMKQMGKLYYLFPKEF